MAGCLLLLCIYSDKHTSFIHTTHNSISKMVLAQPEDRHVLKAFDLSGKVAAVTGMSP